MRYLLDTHVIMWLAYDDAKISKTVKEILLNEESDIFISAVSFWEISLKYQSGKLDLKGHSPETLKAGFDQNFEFSELDLHLEDATTFYKLESTFRKDPFDRMLIWQALEHDMAFITDDENIKRYKKSGLDVIW